MEYKAPKFTDRELLELFPEARKIIPIKIKEVEADICEKKAAIEDQLRRLYSMKTDSFSEWFGEELIRKLVMPELTAMEKNLFRLKRFQQLMHPKSKKSNWFKFEEKIEVARNYSIEAVARDKLELKQAGKNLISLCPFHDEKTPSFYIYPETNSFHCFGCQEHGDVIKLTMALYCLEFKEAVELLQNK
ncbi:MAG: CHC2 zinc finger domain-containing protein [Candidatus Moraniibacteriota bacterium]